MSEKKLKHIAFIVDGNRRWAQSKGLSVVAGHSLAADEIIEKIVFYCLKAEIPYVTFWAFSTENWKRGEKFTKLLFGILEKSLNRNIDKYFEAGIRINTIGDLTKLPENLTRKIVELEKRSKDLKNLTVTIALNYGGREEIIRAINKVLVDYKDINNPSNSINEEVFKKYLDTADLPDVDLIVRTGGEQRLSGFMPWQSIYAEYAFTQTLFPDLTTNEVDKIVKDFNARDRRFGGDSK